MERNRVLITGLPVGENAISHSDLMMYFQSRKKSGGGDVSSLDIFAEDRKALIIFESEIAARDVLKREHKINGIRIQATIPRSLKGKQSPIDKEETSESSSSEDSSDEDSEREDSKKLCSICVRNLPPGITRDSIQTYFENSKKKHGGGPVKTVDYKPSSDCAVVVFQNEKDAKRMVDFQKHKFKKTRIDVTYAESGGTRLLVLEEEKGEKEEGKDEEEEQGEVLDEKRLLRCETQQKSAIPLLFVVSGIANLSTEDSLKHYIENTMRSGGGEVNMLTFNREEDLAEVKLESVKDLNRLLHDKHIIEGVKITVTPKAQEDELPMDPHKIQVKGLNSSTSTDCIRFYIEKMSNVEVKHVQRGGCNNALVSFAESPDFVELSSKIFMDKKGIEDHRISVERVPFCNCLQVSGLSSKITKGQMELYFESPSKGCGAVPSKIELKHHEGKALVYFDDQSVIQKALDKPIHEFEEEKWNLELCYPFLNEEVKTKTEQKPIPEVTEIEVDPEIMHYITTQQGVEWQELQDEFQLELKWAPKKSTVKLMEREASDAREIGEWEARVDVVRKFIGQFQIFEFNVDSFIWGEVLKKVKEISSVHQFNKVTIANLNATKKIRIIAKKEDVQKASKEIEAVICQVKKEKTMQDSVETVVEEDIDSVKLSLLRMSDVYKHLQGNKNVKLNIEEHQGKLTITGPKLLLTPMNMEIFKFFQKIKEEVLELPEGVLQVLQSNKGRNFIEKRFREKQLHAVVVHGQRKAKNEASIFYTNKNQGQEAVKLVDSITNEKSVYIQDETVEVVSNSKWKAFVLSMEESYKVRISFQSVEQTLWISGIEPDASECHSKVEEYVQRNTIYTDSVKLSEGYLRLLFEICIGSIEKIKEELKDSFLEVSKRAGQLIISGTKEGIQKGKEKLMALINNAYEEEIKIEKPGMKKFFQEGHGSTLIKVVETEHQCVVEVAEDLARHKITSTPKSSEFVSHENGECVCSYITKEGKTIAVYKDDITKHKVDCIVNAANGKLQHYAGLAGAIIKEGGNDIRDQCNKYVADNGNLLEGEVMESGPGKLPCKRIIHAVGPRWDDNAKKEYMEGKETKQELLLKFAIENCLERAKNAKTIAIPAVSTGIFGFPVKLCASILTDTVLEFFQENTSCNLSEVHFTNHDDATVESFLAEMKKRFEKKSTFNEGSKKSNLLPKRLYNSSMEVYNKREASKEMEATPFLSLDTEEWVPKLNQTSHRDEPYSTAEGMKIYVKVGNIAHENADILVNTTGETLDLGANACARSFLEVGGPSLQNHCKKIAPIKPGNFGITISTGNLNCKHVFHAVCSSWKIKGKAVLQSILTNCFDEATRLGASSIAIPAIGTGVLKFPRDVVAKLSFEEALQFSRRTKGKGSLKEVMFVVYEQDVDTARAFEDEIKRRKSSNRSPVVMDLFEEPKTTSTKLATVSSTPYFKKRNEKWYEINMDNLSVHVLSGDITQESTDAIAVFSNSDLDIQRGGGAGAAILKAGGDAVKQECKDHPPLLPGKVSMTSAGTLRVKNLIHYVPQDSINEETLFKAVVDCLNAAENQRMSSISFPAIGTGRLGVSPECCAKAMLRGAGSFSMQKPTTLQLIRIVVYQESMIKDFVSVLMDFTGQTDEKVKNMDEKDEVREVGFLRRIGNYLGVSHEPKKDKEPVKEYLQPSKVCLHVYCRDLHHLTEAKKAIDDLVSKNCIKRVIEKPIIASIEKSEMSEIHSVELRFETKITVERRISRIILQGNSDDVLGASSAIHTILDKLKDLENERSKVETIAKNISWQYYSEAKEVFEPYSKSVNVIIEKAFDEDEKMVTFRENGKCFTITFSTNTVKGDEGEGKVRRKDLRIEERNEVFTPSYWVPQPINANGVEETVHLVDLCPNKHAKEYLKVSALFNNTCLHNIVNIGRVQNPTQYHNYAIRKQKMEKEKGKEKDVERLLFHGTAPEICESINHTGFNRSFKGKHAIKYGQGTYFAVNAKFSATSTYSPPDTQGKRFMYLSRVLVGEYTEGDPSMLVPPPKDVSQPTDTYDTVVDNESNPTIFVAFYDWQCYPEYLITFQ